MKPDRVNTGLDAIPAALTLQKFPPRFVDAATEAEYQRYYSDDVAAHVQFGLLTAILMWICVMPLALFIGKSELHTRNLIGLGLVVFLVAIAALGGVMIRRLGVALRAFTAAANLVTGACCIAIAYGVLRHPMLATGGVILTVMYSASFFRLQMIPAVIATTPYLLAMAGLSLVDPSVSTSDFAVIASLLFVTELCALSGVYINDHQMRLGFIQKRIIELQSRELADERAKSDRLLLNVLPAPIATRLRQRVETIAETYPEVTILFSDVVGFTPLADKMPAQQLVDILNRLFSRFDELAARHGLEKIKTIGDAYMAACGVPLENPEHASAAARMALDMMDTLEAFNRETGLSLKMRIGLNTGPVVAGVIGKQKFTYDLWGDAVNTAARMESHGLPGQIQISEATRRQLTPDFKVEDRGVVDVKGKGPMHTWLLVGV